MKKKMIRGAIAAPISLTATILGTRLNRISRTHYSYIEVRINISNMSEKSKFQKIT